MKFQRLVCLGLLCLFCLNLGCEEKSNNGSVLGQTDTSVEKFTVITFQFSNQKPDDRNTVKNKDLDQFVQKFQSEISEKFGKQEIKNYRWFSEKLKDGTLVANLEIEFALYPTSVKFLDSLKDAGLKIPHVLSRPRE